jgi:VWFA-related protein
MALRWLALLLFLLAPTAFCQTSTAPVDPGQDGSAANTGKQDPVLRPRPATKAGIAPKPKRLRLNVVVTDAWGKPVMGLQPWNFQLRDNGRPSKIQYFKAFRGEESNSDPPVEIILLLDTVNLGIQQQAFARNELTRFLAQHNGELAHPVSLMALSDKGLEVQPRPSRDGNSQAALVNKLSPHITAFNPAMGLQGAIERFNLAVHQISRERNAQTGSQAADLDRIRMADAGDAECRTGTDQ